MSISREIFEEIARRSGCSEAKVSKVIYTASGFARDVLRYPQRPKFLWNGLFYMSPLSCRVEGLVESSGKRFEESGTASDKEKMEYYSNLHEIIKQYGDECRKKDKHHNADE